MKILNFKKNDISMVFGINGQNKLLVLYIGSNSEYEKYEENDLFVPVELLTTGSNPKDHRGAKHTGGNSLFYKKHTETENEISFYLENEYVLVKLVYEFYEGINVVKAHSEIKNISDSNVGIEYISSFCVYNIFPEKIYIPHSSWCREFNWKEYTPSELGYSKINWFSTKRIAASNTGTWSTKEYLPIGIISGAEGTMFWQIEHNGSWNWEISDAADVMYLKLSGPSEGENGWWKDLKPNETFVSVATAVAIVKGNITEAVAQMTEYRRKIAYRSSADAELPVIFNDYMGCLSADPTTEKLMPVIDAAADCGAEIFCMDAGWYADGKWWDTVGEWQVCEKRFSNGMGEVYEHIRMKNMIGGIWLEPESIGINCPILDNFDDSCFFMRHGKRVVYNGRYQFDFRNKKVTDFLDSVVDRLISEYKIGYFKFDYNIDGGVGTEYNADSFGDGLMQHNIAYLKWIDGIYKRHPRLIIENCSSGGLRMDYKTLSHFSLQSLTDAECYSHIAAISSVSQTGVIPEQAAVWCIPKKEDSMGEIAINLVSTMFKRVHLSGETPWLNDEQKQLVKEGISFYKSIRKYISNMTAFYPIGFCDFESKAIVCGYKDKEREYLCISNLSSEEDIFIPGSYGKAEICYPQKSDAEIKMSENGINVKLPLKSGIVVKVK